MKSPADVKNLAQRLEESLLSVFVGSSYTLKPILAGYLAGMHVLLEDIPGVGKTTLALSLAKSCDLEFARIQFTPDLLPGDIIGMTVWDSEQRGFQFKSGSINHQFILADEINRASERTQSALLEAMAEGAVTVDGQRHQLPQPFFVVATQNPISFAGTFLLPESQTDRFGISAALGYPSADSEKTILNRFKEDNPLDNLKPVCTAQDIMAARNIISAVHIADAVQDYIIDIASATRRDSRFRLGVSPRGSLHLMQASQAAAAMEGRDFVIPEDVKRMSLSVLPHRIRLSSDARNNSVSEKEALEEVLVKIRMPAAPKG